MSRLAPWRAGTLVLACILFPAVPVFAQRPPSADEREIASYRLTMAAFSQVAAATRVMADAMKNDPRVMKLQTLKQELEALEKKDELSDAEAERAEKLSEDIEALEREEDALFDANDSLDQMEAKLKQHPQVSRALSSAGMAPRDYAKFMAAFLQAAMTHAFQKQGLIKQAPEGVNLENVKFIAEHDAEIAAFQKEMEALGRRR